MLLSRVGERYSVIENRASGEAERGAARGHEIEGDETDRDQHCATKTEENRRQKKVTPDAGQACSMCIDIVRAVGHNLAIFVCVLTSIP